MAVMSPRPRPDKNGVRVIETTGISSGRLTGPGNGTIRGQADQTPDGEMPLQLLFMT